MDFDPDGIRILSTYKNGSWVLSHENDHLNVPEIQWLGIQSGDLTDDHGHENARQGLLPMSASDRKRARDILKKNAMAETEMEVKWMQEVRVMLMLSMKAEIEMLNERREGLEGWLEGKLMGQGQVKVEEEEQEPVKVEEEF